MLIEKPIMSSRITVRNYQKSDLSYLTAMWFDEENGKYMSDPTAEYADNEYQKCLDELENNEFGYYLTVVLNGSEKIIGSACIFPDEKKEIFDIGYCIHKDYWGKRFGSELLYLIVTWICNHGGIEITAEVAQDNIASNKLLVNNGFKIKKESLFKKYKMNVCFNSFIYTLSCKNLITN